MDSEELDLTVIAATDEYTRGTKTVPASPGGNGARGEAALAEAEKAALASQIAHLEDELEAWQRRTVVWRERALSAQALNEALNRHLEDLRVVIHRLPGPGVDSPAGAPNGRAPEHAMPATLGQTTVGEWCTRVFRREFWTSSR